MPSLVEIGSVVLERRFFNSVNVFSPFRQPSGSGEEGFLISSMYFRYFIIISPWKRAGPFICTNLNPLHPGILCAKLGWNWPSSSQQEKKILKIESVALHLFKLVSPSPKDTLCQVWLKLAQWFWRRRWKCEQFPDRQTYGRTTGDQKSSLELSAQVS